MGALDLVAWPALYRALLQGADPAAVDRAAWHATQGLAFRTEAVVFAVLVNAAHPSDVRRLVVEHARDPDTPAATVERVTRWLLDTARWLQGVVGSLADPTPPPRQQAGRCELVVDPQLGGLPLLPLAQDLARVRGGLTVEARALPPGVAGRYDPRRRLVVLDLDQGGLASWPHEFAHALDPELPRQVDGLHTPEADERFADHLAPLLVAHQPATLANAEPLILDALGQVAPQLRHPTVPEPDPDGLPPAGVESLARFLALPLLDQVAAS